MILKLVVKFRFQNVLISLLSFPFLSGLSQSQFEPILGIKTNARSCNPFQLEDKWAEMIEIWCYKGAHGLGVYFVVCRVSNVVKCWALKGEKDCELGSSKGQL